jgi:2'-5' RNA ligase
VPPADVDAALVARVADVVRSVPGFACRFDRCAWFDEDVLWLAPERAQPFRDLTSAVCAVFPVHPPYGGAHPDLTPHLTIGQRSSEADLAQLRKIEQSVTARLPVSAYVDEVHLIAGTAALGSWRTLHVLGLAPGR